MKDIANNAEFIRLQEVVTETCKSIAFHAYSDIWDSINSGGYYNHLYEKVQLTDEQREITLEYIVDNNISCAFSTISLCFPDFCSIDDTVTRNCARGAIHDVVAMCIEQSVKPGQTTDIINEHLDLSEVWDDLIAMNEDEDDSDGDLIAHLEYEDEDDSDGELLASVQTS